MPKPQPKPKDPSSPPMAEAGSLYWTDDRLIRGCLAGKEEAWTALLEKYKNLIFSIPIKHRLPQADAAEIFQAVCAELLSEMPKLRDPQALSGWLIKVTAHKCFHWHKEQQRWNHADEETQIAATPIEKLADNLLIELEKEQMLREAIAKLSPRCRELVQILFYEDPPRPYKDVAESLGIAVGSIGFIRGRCLDKLRASLEALEFKKP
jgi:RNA polymerase sigma factor (sigma-70 family)